MTCLWELTFQMQQMQNTIVLITGIAIQQRDECQSKAILHGQMLNNSIMDLLQDGPIERGKPE